MNGNALSGFLSIGWTILTTRVCERQKLGTVILLVASIAVYGGIYICHERSFRESLLPRLNQGPGMMAIEVVGDYGSEGIYFSPTGTTLAEVLKFSGYGTKIATSETTDVFPADQLASTITLKGRIVTVSPMPAAKRLALGLPIDLNQASFEDLMLIPGIGTNTAGRIVQLRQSRRKFVSVSELALIPGLKEKRIEELRRHLTVTSLD